MDAAPYRGAMRVLLTVTGVGALALLVAQCGDGGGGSSRRGTFAGGFLGLANVSENVTQCGECHPSEQALWAETRHAHAYATLVDREREDPELSCALCHNVGPNGNELDDPMIGFRGEPVPELRNVQCESCHGPGATHVTDVKQHPDAALGVDFDLGCGECHQDDHHPFVDEWLESAHAESHLSGSAFGLDVAGDPECAYCHVAQSFIRFVETDGVERVISSEPLPITCVACHDPHGNGNAHQVRVIANEPIVCGQCHNAGPATIGEEPHHPQRDLLLGTGGFEFPGESFPGPATHGNTDINPDLCVTCHVVTAPFQSAETPIPAQVGHTFIPVPVIDEATGERDFDNCLDCHANPAAIFESHQAEVRMLITELEEALEAVPADQRSGEIYEGALFNLELVQADKSTGVHNPERTLRLLEVSIEKLAEL